MSSIASPRFYVYILCRPDGRPFYVGKGMGDRIDQHEREAKRGHKCHKCNIIRKILRQGEQIQKYVMLTTDDEQEAFDYECELIALHGRKNLANLTDGGEGASGQTVSPEAAERKRKVLTSPEYRARQSAANKLRFANPEERAKISAANRRTWASPERRAALSAKVRATWASPELRERQRVRATATMAIPEVRARVSAAVRAALARPEEKARRSAKAKAATASPEVRARMSASSRAALASPEARARQGAAVKASWVRRKAAKAASEGDK